MKRGAEDSSSKARSARIRQRTGTHRRARPTAGGLVLVFRATCFPRPARLPRPQRRAAHLLLHPDHPPPSLAPFLPFPVFMHASTSPPLQQPLRVHGDAQRRHGAPLPSESIAGPTCWRATESSATIAAEVTKITRVEFQALFPQRRNTEAAVYKGEAQRKAALCRCRNKQHRGGNKAVRKYLVHHSWIRSP